MFRPRPSLWQRTAPSGLFNRSPVAGLVNDRNAVTLGGAAGHAGLFGTGHDLARYAQAWLSEGELPGGGRWVRAETLREFLTPSHRAGSRRLGIGQFFAHFDEDNDGTVAVSETMIPGLTDHLVLPHSHIGMLFASDVADQVAHFLRHGHFDRAKKGGAEAPR